MKSPPTRAWERKWLARIRDSEQGKRRNLGYFVKEEKAAEAYEAALKERKNN